MKSHFDAHTLRKSILAFTVAIGVGFLLINLLGYILSGRMDGMMVLLH
jgi:hypothetical protein